MDFSPKNINKVDAFVIHNVVLCQNKGEKIKWSIETGQKWWGWKRQKSKKQKNFSDFHCWWQQQTNKDGGTVHFIFIFQLLGVGLVLWDREMKNKRERKIFRCTKCVLQVYVWVSFKSLKDEKQFIGFSCLQFWFSIIFFFSGPSCSFPRCSSSTPSQIF